MQNDPPAKSGSKASRWPAQSIRQLGHKGKKAGYKFPRKSHSKSHEISYVDYGRMFLELDNSSLVLASGECVLIPAHTSHSTQSEQNRPFSFLNIMYDGRCPAALSKKRLVLTPEERKLMADLKQESESHAPYHGDMLLLKLNLLLLSLARNHRKQLANLPIVGTNRTTHNHQIASRALGWLEAHLQEPLNPEAAAQHAGVSASHLRKLMKQETGKSLSQHLKTLRVELAKQLLMESPLNMNELAWRVGYTSAPHFCTVFKKETGKTATEFAKSLGQPTI